MRRSRLDSEDLTHIIMAGVRQSQEDDEDEEEEEEEAADSKQRKKGKQAKNSKKKKQGKQPSNQSQEETLHLSMHFNFENIMYATILQPLPSSATSQTNDALSEEQLNSNPILLVIEELEG
jgi:hypothetical protein